jgi:catechol 2,3-dioxygenase-like lactoylglutathione lyase family enzyme
MTALIPELYCTKFEISLNFYTIVLGFSALYQREEEGFAMLERQGAKLMIDSIDPQASRSWITGKMDHPFGRGINLQIKTADIDTLYEQVQQSAAQIFLPMEEKWYRANDVYVGNKQFIVLDPDGYMLRFFEDIGSKPNLD